MIRLLFALIFKLKGWRTRYAEGVNPDEVKKSIFLAAPHTSNWDFVFCVEGCRQLGIPLRFAIKKEWMTFPFNLAIGPMGGIAIDRSASHKGKRTNMVDDMAALFEGEKEKVVLICPEATRSRKEIWKKGFYQTALKAQVPISLAYLDYAKKEAGVGRILHPSGNFEEDMRIIMDFYKDMTAKVPENFALDKRFSPRPLEQEAL
ncbi:1-acyl-sn-glycerol-3-phosphate acyltransferase [Algivirga pacifica]|uniref:Lysophospholipid acyltransferase family protein n=1 Tax=Algivirga pacifica TaxID=1162670 RepID=A0ABP9DAE8_9BACT